MGLFTGERCSTLLRTGCARHTRGFEIQQQARELHAESESSGRRANRFHVGEVLLEIAIVFSSLSILSKMRSFFWIGASAGVMGLVVALTAWFA